MASKRLSVSQLNGYIKSVFDDELILHNIALFGELSQLSVHDGISYFTVTEGGCYVNCVMFSAVEKIEEGAQILAYGKVTYYAKSGKVNFTARSISVTGKGKLIDEFRRLKETLRKEGLFDNHPDLPVYIGNIAVITSESGAVIHDINSVICSKKSDIDIMLLPVSVQGNNAEADIIDALDKANSYDVDAVIIARGGGSNYDLDIFNSEKLARAVAKSSVPVISAIGHETDYTLCDFCASVRAGTPSIAAGIITDINVGFFARFQNALQKINIGINNIFSNSLSVAKYAALCVTHAMDKKIQSYCFDIIRQLSKIYNSIDESYKKNASKLTDCASRLEFSNPLKILSKGYTKVLLSNHRIDSVTELRKGDRIDLIFKDGRATANIENIDKKVLR